MPLSDKPVAVVTGAASGIGHACTIAYLRSGVNVVAGIVMIASQLSKDPRTKQRKGYGSFEILGGDISSNTSRPAHSSSSQTCLAGSIISLTNAGNEFVAPLMETSEEDFDRVMDINVKGTFIPTKPAWR